MHDDQDHWIRGEYQPFSQDGTPPLSQRVGIPFKDKLLVVRWLMQRYDLSMDQAMQDTDALERFMEINR